MNNLQTESFIKPRLLAMLTISFWLLFSVMFAFAAPVSDKKPVSGTDATILEVFVRDGCPHCAAAKEFLPTFIDAHPGIQLIYRDVTTDESARADLLRHTLRAGASPPGVPTFVVNESVLIGFDNPEITGAALSALLDSEKPAPAVYESRLFGVLNVTELGLPLFTLAMGLLDGFNPCAMWVLLFLLSMLIHLHDRRRMALIAGTFIVVSGAVYYAFMAAWLNFFLIIGLSETVRLGLAIVAVVFGVINIKDFIAFGRGISLSIPESSKPRLYKHVRNIIQTQSLFPALASAITLAIAVNFIELLCTAGLPAIYTAVLTKQALTSFEHYSYLLLYIMGYMFDDTVMAGTAVIALSSRKLTEHAGRWLKLLSGAIMLALGIVMALWPELLVSI